MLYQIKDDHQLQAAFWLLYESYNTCLFKENKEEDENSKSTYNHLVNLIDAIGEYLECRQRTDMSNFVLWEGGTSASLKPAEYTYDQIYSYLEPIRRSLHHTPEFTTVVIHTEALERSYEEARTSLAEKLKPNLENIINTHKALNDWIQANNIKSHGDLKEHFGDKKGEKTEEDEEDEESKESKKDVVFRNLVTARSLLQSAVIYFDMLRLLGEKIDEKKYNRYRELLKIDNDDKFINELLFLEPSNEGDYSFSKYALKVFTWGVLIPTTISMKVLTAFGLMLDRSRGALVSIPNYYGNFFASQIPQPDNPVLSQPMEITAILAATINALDTLLTRGKAIGSYFNGWNLDEKCTRARSQFFAPLPEELSSAEYWTVKLGHGLSIPGVFYDALTGAMGAVVAAGIMLGEERIGGAKNLAIYLLGAASAGASSFTFQLLPVEKNLKEFIKILEQFYQEGRTHLLHNA